jgi:hypothetical protein
MANALPKSCVSLVGIWLNPKKSFQIIRHTDHFLPPHEVNGASQNTDTWREKPVGLAAEQPVTWPRDGLLSFRKQVGAVISHQPEGFFPFQPLRRQ